MLVKLHLLKRGHPLALLVVLGACGDGGETSSIATSMTSDGSVTLSWQAPTKNTDGSTLTDLAGYRVHYGTAPDNYTESLQLSDPALTSVVIENLALGQWYFAVTAYNSAGLESDFSDSVVKLIQ